eukprot:TRINITY_DN4343_c0_g1_i1.p1 TRINITY_DN4343_c0_g1~~TRINITY_DN4343_c0_g1_i1.p1  ORF type:complete len:119 (-),score=3.75 TRINITY_DN4343_c0_g1_i1:505-861(-)
MQLAGQTVQAPLLRVVLLRVFVVYLEHSVHWVSVQLLQFASMVVHALQVPEERTYDEGHDVHWRFVSHVKHVLGHLLQVVPSKTYPVPHSRHPLSEHLEQPVVQETQVLFTLDKKYSL